MVRASRSIVDPVKAYAAPATTSNVINLNAINLRDAIRRRAFASLRRPLVALLCRRDWPAVTAAFGGEADIDEVRRDVWK